MTALSFEPRWLASNLDDTGEAQTFAEIAVSVAGEPLARLKDRDTNEISRGTRIPAMPLAHGIAEHWWRLLYEPEKHRDRRFESRHRLDVMTPGYVFPPLALWSGGDGIVARLLTPDLRFQRHIFVLPERDEPWYLPRLTVEASLSKFINETLSRLSPNEGSELREAWERVFLSQQDPDEQAWCKAAGRLGFDPYDSATPDLQTLAGSLSAELFAELSEATTTEDLVTDRNWIEAHLKSVASAPEVEIGDFGPFPRTEPDDHPAHQGYHAALRLRTSLGFESNPGKVIPSLIGTTSATVADTSGAVQGITNRINGVMRAVVAARDDVQRRFRMCHAIFVAWEASPGEDRLISLAKTRRHQAARAFAAELLVPSDLLRERTAGRRPTESQIEQWAHEFDATSHMVREQLWNHLHLTPRAA